ncbi:hypothetical protein BC940DRAFT_290697 [Gongronella butleri]|nr:hypothetical protein BC940DRAFT_290697 [Gongronella butleri]
MEHESPIVSQQVFGSSKKLQFVSMSSMRSRLTAMDEAKPIQLPSPPPSCTAKRHMSIESMLTTNGDDENDALSRHNQRKRPWEDNAPVSNKMPRYTTPLSPPPSSAAAPVHGSSSKMTVTCYHAIVAQKSYGSEKRFLCPPPMVQLQPNEPHAQPYKQQLPLVSMSVVAEHQGRPVEQHGYVSDQQNISFKYLHVTGSAKTKHFALKLNLAHGMAHAAFASFFSNPISIISKPSKKTAKARNISTCIFATSKVSLFNRINSQTVRTKYLTTCDQTGQLCAKNTSWAAFDIELVKSAPASPPSLTSHQYHYHHLHQPSVSASGPPLTYGSEIILKHTESGIATPAVIIRKVDKNIIATDASGPVSQMQKVALQVASSVGQPHPVFLSANGQLIQPDTPELAQQQQQQQQHDATAAAAAAAAANASTWLDYSPATANAQGDHIVNDHLCWTIVGIAKFEYTVDTPVLDAFHAHSQPVSMTHAPILPTSPAPTVSSSVSSNSTPSSPTFHPHHHPSPPPSPPRTIMPLPMITSVEYKMQQHQLHISGRHLTQWSSQTHQQTSLLAFWLGGTHHPLHCVPYTPSETNGLMQLTLTLPPTQDLLIAHHDLLVNHPNGERTMELPLLMVRKDNTVYHSGKAAVCHIKPNGDTCWSVLDVSVKKP